MYMQVAPARERGLKCLLLRRPSTYHGRSREGAWIEIIRKNYFSVKTGVAPVRERGLKCRFEQ